MLDAQLRSILDEKLEPFRALQAEMNELRAFVEEANNKYDEVVKRMADHETSSKAIAAENKVLKSALHTMESRVNHLTSVCNDLEQYSRRECVEVRGIPVTKDEGTNDIVVKVAELMDIEIEEDDVSISHRLPTSKEYKRNNVEPVIIVKFVRIDVKESFYKARSALKRHSTKNLGYRSDNHIYINESLTKKNKDFFNTCVKAKKKLQYDYI